VEENALLRFVAAISIRALGEGQVTDKCWRRFGWGFLPGRNFSTIGNATLGFLVTFIARRTASLKFGATNGILE